MEIYARNFIRVSLICLILGLIMGLAMVIHPNLLMYRSVHVHLLLLGFMAMMIFGVGYHIIPRFQGHAIIPRAWATLHLYLASGGLSLMIVGWILGRGTGGSVMQASGFLLFLGALGEFTGVIIFLAILWRGLIPVQRKAVKND